MDPVVGSLPSLIDHNQGGIDRGVFLEEKKRTRRKTRDGGGQGIHADGIKMAANESMSHLIYASVISPPLLSLGKEVEEKGPI